MKLKEFFSRGRPVFSFEFFPPKTEEDLPRLYQTVRDLKELNPSFVTCTYGAGGSTRRKTLEIVAHVKKEIGIESVAHLTCAGHSRQEIEVLLQEIAFRGIENVMALRGDPPRGEAKFVPHPEGFKHADELVAHIKSRHDFSLGVAGYPEKHPEAASPEQDLQNLKRKVEAGADAVFTQLFFINEDYFEFVKRARQIGIGLPIVPGIMPITNVAQIKRFTSLCGAKIPEAMIRDLERIESDPRKVVEYGIEYSTRQCLELLEKGAPGIHFYTLNKSHSAQEILKKIR